MNNRILRAPSDPSRHFKNSQTCCARTFRSRQRTKERQSVRLKETDKAGERQTQEQRDSEGGEGRERERERGVLWCIFLPPNLTCRTPISWLKADLLALPSFLAFLDFLFLTRNFPAFFCILLLPVSHGFQEFGREKNAVFVGVLYFFMFPCTERKRSGKCLFPRREHLSWSRRPGAHGGG